MTTSVEPFDLATEALFIGSLYSNPILIVEYESLVKSKYDFYDEDTKFLYNSFELFYKTFSQEVTESKVTMFMKQDEERWSKFREIGGWKTIERQMELADTSDILNYFHIVKKYSLIREFGRKGFPVEKLLNNKHFHKMKPDDIVNFMSYNISNISTVIGGGNSAVVLGNDATRKIEEWSITPDMGEEFPFEAWTNLFRGWRTKKLILDGMLSNEGKSRKVARIAAYMSLLKKQPMLILANEMDEDEFFAMMLSTVMNSSEFGFNYNIPERNVLLGSYDDDDQYQKALEVGKYIEENTKVYFLEMNSYSDEDLKREIKKYSLLGVKYCFYDTLKGYKTDAWDTLKQTATLLKDIAKELDIGVYGSFQLSDEASSLDIEDFTSGVIANSKQMKHICDHMLIGRRIEKHKYDKYLITNEWGEYPLDQNKMYYGTKVEKNRGGAKGLIVLYEVDLDMNTWVEAGYLKIVKKDKKKKEK
ncbi:DnaB-like helicase C-terminal domain-containing protein [Fictibacillus nanhaiensis]|uniref:DnaB-like helicase C-terminal domain-containing protein n=1 Tax=Fictibacillus nanhaiensis TaxID=742169 RepID=UPI002E2325AD|nr:DnaB-like helicase C-terminal domain-containing protein [Fictibacillus nanhaiensis]